MKLTINDIAKLCNVSTGTVNRALHNKPGISEKTKAKILDIVKELDYRPDYYARTLASGKTDTIGIILPNVENEFFAMLFSEVEKICWEYGYLMNLALSNDDADKEEKYILSFIDRKVDGLILFPVNNDATYVKKAIQNDISTVIVLNDLEDVDTNVVKVDEYNAVSKTVQYLIDIGHKRIAYINGYFHYSPRYNSYINDQRYQAFKDTMVLNHIMYEKENYMEATPHLNDEINRIMLKNIVCRENKPTAMVCLQDRIALWVMMELEKMGLKVPDDISIAGFDNINELNYVKPLLTTTQMPTKEIAHTAVSILVDDISNNRCGNKKVVLETRFIERDSCRRI
ncbi:MAG TPA: LacI family transcriptional regulator [Clostridiaceae bacterium]|jgi:LacI family transcriptional regulator|nr:LacI family transcriptional regulator [Clostridiaceae bacterium]